MAPRARATSSSMVRGFGVDDVCIIDASVGALEGIAGICFVGIGNGVMALGSGGAIITFGTVTAGRATGRGVATTGRGACTGTGGSGTGAGAGAV